VHLFPPKIGAGSGRDFFLRPPLTATRVVLAVLIAVAADGLQFFLGPFGWTFADQIIDVIAMILITLTIGFHPLFLPTFVAEFVPVLGMLPTWTGCVVLAVYMMGKREQNATPTPPVTRPPSDVIDV
jgi:hypothetical protein